ncbi:MAG: hypothetical protein AAF391_08065 [Bacteroidota bacterium]
MTTITTQAKGEDVQAMLLRTITEPFRGRGYRITKIDISIVNFDIAFNSFVRLGSETEAEDYIIAITADDIADTIIALNPIFAQRYELIAFRAMPWGTQLPLENVQIREVWADRKENMIAEQVAMFLDCAINDPVSQKGGVQ